MPREKSPGARASARRGEGLDFLLETVRGFAFLGLGHAGGLRQRFRLRQANLMGPSGFVSNDDGEIMEFSQHGIDAFPRDEGVVEMGGRDVRNEDHMVTEAAIRGFYREYRRVMGF